MVAVKIFFACSARDLIPIFHFQNDGATIESSRLMLLQIQLAIPRF